MSQFAFLTPRPALSVIVIAYNMTRELPRTVLSLSPKMQKGISAADYEITVVDNGSSRPFDEQIVRSLAPNVSIFKQPHPTVSPARAINTGLAKARGELIGVMIDGARMASPGLLASALGAAKLGGAQPVVGTLAFHLGPEVQMTSCQKGYNQAVEDRLLQDLDWQSDGYRLFDGSVFAGSSALGWHNLPAETNAIFLKRDHWRRLGGYDEQFLSRGGGLVNFDVWRRVCDDPRSEVIMVLGEGTFHQVHGGVATNNAGADFASFLEEYRQIRGQDFALSTRQPRFYGVARPVTPASIRLETSASG